MKIGFSADVSEFSRVLKLYMDHCRKDFAEILNTKAFYISRGASRNTVKADRAKMESELGVSGYRVKIGKRGNPLMRKGQVRWERVYKQAPMVSLIVNARLGRAGKKGLWGAEMRKASEKVIVKRRRSIGTLKAGWLGAIRKFGKAIGQTSSVDGASSIIRGRGGGKVAKGGWNESAEIYYDVNSFDREHRPSIDRRVAEALEKAFYGEVESMWTYIKGKMNGTLKKFEKPKMTEAAAIAEVRRVMAGKI